MLSMTGYGRAEAQIDGRKWIVEIKSLNHRYIEIITRLPNALSSLEVDIKKRVGERIFRGRIEVSVQADAESGGDSGVQYSLNLPLLRNYHSLLLRIKEELDLDDQSSWGPWLASRRSSSLRRRASIRRRPGESSGRPSTGPSTPSSGCAAPRARSSRRTSWHGSTP